MPTTLRFARSTAVLLSAIMAAGLWAAQAAQADPRPAPRAKSQAATDPDNCVLRRGITLTYPDERQGYYSYYCDGLADEWFYRTHASCRDRWGNGYAATNGYWQRYPYHTGSYCRKGDTDIFNGWVEIAYCPICRASSVPKAAKRIQPKSTVAIDK